MTGLVIESVIFTVLVLILITLIIEEKRLKKMKLQPAKVTGAWKGAERRAHIRIDTILSIKYSINHEKKNSLSKNISCGGILIQLSEKLSESTPLRLDIHLPDTERPVFARGEVVWVKDLPHIDEAGRRIFDTGVKFTWMHPKDRERLDKHITGLL